VTYIAIDQYGNRVMCRTRHPRKELMAYMGRQHVDKMYVGDDDHVGYVIGGAWWSLYHVDGRGIK
jgi:hypothetical protein